MTNPDSSSPSPVPAPSSAVRAADAVAGLPAMLTFSEVAGFLRISTRTVRRYVRSGRLTACRTAASGSGRVRVTREEVARLLVAMEVKVPFGEGR